MPPIIRRKPVNTTSIIPSDALSSPSISNRFPLSVRQGEFKSVVVVELGVIQEIFPFNRLYKVALNAGPHIICTYSGDSGFSKFSVKSQTVLSVGTTVVLIRVPGINYGLIVSAVPPVILNTGQHFPDEITQGVNIGTITDSFYKDILDRQPATGGGLPAWQGTSIDSFPGEWVQMADTGLAIFLSSFLGGIRANEYCGLWVHYPNSLLRVAGFNFQEWTGGSEYFSIVHGQSIVQYRGYGYLLQQQKGARDPLGGDECFGTVNNYDSSVSNASSIEHKTVFHGETNRISRFPVHFVQKWEGIVGGGGINYVFRKTTRDGSPVLFPVAQYGATHGGFIVARSAAGILLSKAPYLSAPIRAADLDEKSGEIQDDVERGKITSLLQTFSVRNTYTLESKLSIGYSIFDIANMVFNWEAPIGFYLYPKKFKFHRELDGFLARKVVPKLFGGPSLEKTSFVYLDPWGNILLQDGNGARIELRDGAIRISAPNGVYIDSGNELKMLGNEVHSYAEENLVLLAGKKMEIRNPPGTSSDKKEEFLVFDRENGGSFSIKYGFIEVCERKSPPLSAYTFPTQPWVINAEKEGAQLYDVQIVSADTAFTDYEPVGFSSGVNIAGCPTDYNSIDTLNTTTQIYANSPFNEQPQKITGLKRTKGN